VIRRIQNSEFRIQKTENKREEDTEEIAREYNGLERTRKTKDSEGREEEKRRIQRNAWGKTPPYKTAGKMPAVQFFLR